MLLAESLKKIEFVANQLGNKLVDRFTKDRSPGKPKLDGAEAIVTWIGEQGDPTGVALKFLSWITREYIKAQFQIEDLGQVKQLIQQFINHRNKLTNKDINKYEYKELEGILDKFRDNDEMLSNKQLERALIARGDAVEIFKSPNIRVISPKTKEAAIAFGIGTKWCTSAQNSYNAFEDYNREGPLYIIYTRAGRFQFHFEGEQFMDEKDHPVKLSTLLSVFPEIYNVFRTEFQKLELGVEYSEILPLLKNPERIKRANLSNDAAFELLSTAPTLYKYLPLQQRLNFAHHAIRFDLSNVFEIPKAAFDIELLHDIFLKGHREGGGWRSAQGAKYIDHLRKQFNGLTEPTSSEFANLVNYLSYRFGSAGSDTRAYADFFFKIVRLKSESMIWLCKLIPTLIPQIPLTYVTKEVAKDLENEFVTKGLWKGRVDTNQIHADIKAKILQRFPTYKFTSKFEKSLAVDNNTDTEYQGLEYWLQRIEIDMDLSYYEVAAFKQLSQDEREQVLSHIVNMWPAAKIYRDLPKEFLTPEILYALLEKDPSAIHIFKSMLYRKMDSPSSLKLTLFAIKSGELLAANFIPARLLTTPVVRTIYKYVKQQVKPNHWREVPEMIFFSLPKADKIDMLRRYRGLGSDTAMNDYMVDRRSPELLNAETLYQIYHDEIEDLRQVHPKAVALSEWVKLVKKLPSALKHIDDQDTVIVIAGLLNINETRRLRLANVSIWDA